MREIRSIVRATESNFEAANAVQLSSRQRRFVGISIAVLLALRVLGMFFVPYTDTTEARYAEIARKMMETNDWITPQFDYGVPFWGKPPLHTWVSALGMKIFGANEFGGRIFIFAIACGMVALLYRWVKKERGRDMAMLATLGLLGCGIFFVSMAAVMTDLVMLFGTSLCMVVFWNALEREKNRRLWGYLFFVGLAIGLLAKGPVATALTGVPIGMWVLFQNRWKDTWQRIPWIKGTLLMLLIAGPWYALAEHKTPGFLKYFIVGEHIERFLVKGWSGDLYGRGHAKARGMIWVLWILAVLPWTPFYLAPFRRTKTIIQGMKGAEGSWPFYLLCWATSPMLFFTVATNIIPTYVITGVPAGCILAVELWSMVANRDPVPSRLAIRFFAGTSVAATAIFALGLLSFNGFIGLSRKKSQKQMVADVEAMSVDSPSVLNYWPKRIYSAEFYSRGAAKAVVQPEEIAALLTNDERDFLVVRKAYQSAIPQDLLDSFTEVEEVGGDVLMLEKPQTLNAHALAQ